MTKRRNTFLAPTIRDGVTARRASQAASLGDAAGIGSKVDRKGRISPDMGPEFFLDRNQWRPRNGETIAWTPGSPPRPEVMLDKIISDDGSMAVDRVGLKSQPNTSQIKNDTSIEGADLLEVLERIQTNKENKIAKGAPNGYAPLDASSLVPLANLPTGTGAGLDADTLDGKDSTDFLLRDGSNEMGGTLNLDSNNISSVGTLSYFGGGEGLRSDLNLSDVDSASDARSNLGLSIGVNVQAYDADLDALASSGSSGSGAFARVGSPNFTGAPTVGESGGVSTPLVLPRQRILRCLVADPSGTTQSLIGWPAAATTSGTVAAAAGTNRHFQSFTTAGTTGSASGIVTAAANYARRNYKASLITSFRTQSDISDVRIWSGFFSGGDPSGASTASGHVAAFRYATDVDGTVFWRAVTRDNVTTDTNALATAIAAGTEYVLRIDMDGTRVEFWIDDVLVLSTTTNLPSGTQTLGFATIITTLVNSAKSIRWGSWQWLQNS